MRTLFFIRLLTSISVNFKKYRIVLPGMYSPTAFHLGRHIFCTICIGFPSKKRINFKMAVLTYKTLSTNQPAYLNDFVSNYNPSRTLRSSNQALLTQPSTRTTIGARAFSSAAPRVWNAIPLGIRQAPTLTTFKHHLKTHLFTSSP